MRILLDQNLSPKLVRRLADLFPSLESAYEHGLTAATDTAIFSWARESGFAAVISADLDFVNLVGKIGSPPKVIRIEHCDFPSRVIEGLVRRDAVRIHRFLKSDQEVLLLKL